MKSVGISSIYDGLLLDDEKEPEENLHDLLIDCENGGKWCEQMVEWRQFWSGILIMTVDMKMQTMHSSRDDRDETDDKNLTAKKGFNALQVKFVWKEIDLRN